MIKQKFIKYVLFKNRNIQQVSILTMQIIETVRYCDLLLFLSMFQNTQRFAIAQF